MIYKINDKEVSKEEFEKATGISVLKSDNYSYLKFPHLNDHAKEATEEADNVISNSTFTPKYPYSAPKWIADDTFIWPETTKNSGKKKRHLQKGLGNQIKRGITITYPLTGLENTEKFSERKIYWGLKPEKGDKIYWLIGTKQTEIVVTDWYLVYLSPQELENIKNINAAQKNSLIIRVGYSETMEKNVADIMNEVKSQEQGISTQEEIDSLKYPNTYDNTQEKTVKALAKDLTYEFRKAAERRVKKHKDFVEVKGYLVDNGLWELSELLQILNTDNEDELNKVLKEIGENKVTNIKVTNESQIPSQYQEELDNLKYKTSEEVKKPSGIKHNKNKLQMGKLFEQFPNALQAIVLASTYGANKYKEGDIWSNLFSVSGGFKTYIDAGMRHSLDLEDVDEESGLPHLVHASWNFLAALEIWVREQNIDMKDFSKNFIENI